MSDKRWRIRLSAEAEADFVRILEYTLTTYGARKLEAYKATLLDALAALEFGPDIPGSAARDDILPGLRTLHIARKGRRGRHFILFRASPDYAMDLLRILHDQMDLPRHIPPQAR